MHTDRTYAVQFAGFEQRVPKCFCLARFDPELVAEIARKARARHHHLDAFEVAMQQTKNLELIEARNVQTAQGRVRRWTLHGKARNLCGLDPDIHVEADSRIVEPVEMPFLRAQAIVALT